MEGYLRQNPITVTHIRPSSPIAVQNTVLNGDRDRLPLVFRLFNEYLEYERPFMKVPIGNRFHIDRLRRAQVDGFRMDCDRAWRSSRMKRKNCGRPVPLQCLMSIPKQERASRPMFSVSIPRQAECLAAQSACSSISNSSMKCILNQLFFLVYLHYYFHFQKNISFTNIENRIINRYLI